MWAEGGLVDRIDKAISRPIFHSRFGVLEYVLTVPGMWFGIPAFATFLGPVTLGTLMCTVRNGTDAARMQTFAALAMLTYFMWWCKCCLESKQSKSEEMGGGIMTAYLPMRGKYGVPFLLLVPHTALLAITVVEAHSHQARAAACFFLCSWIIANLICEIGKKLSRRQRPCVALRKELESVPRELPQIQAMLRVRSAAQSFPSGDTAGAAAWATTGYVITGRMEFAAVVVIAAYGRMFFHAHHLLDVFTGGSIGAIVVLTLDRLLGAETFTWWHYLAAQFTHIVIWRRLNKFPERFGAPAC